MTKDNVNSPSHYTQAGTECIDAITAAVSGKSGIEAVCVANVIKYLWRYELKNGVEDVKKAQWYLNRLVSELGEPVSERGEPVSELGAPEPVLDDKLPIAATCKHNWEYLHKTGRDFCTKCGATR